MQPRRAMCPNSMPFRKTFSLGPGAPARHSPKRQALALGPPMGPDLTGLALRGPPPLGSAFLVLRRAPVPAIAEARSGANLGLRIAVAPVRRALAPLIAGSVGGFASLLAHALGPVAAVALLNASAPAIALAPVKLAVTVAPVAPVEFTSAMGAPVRPREPAGLVAMDSVGRRLPMTARVRIGQIDISVTVDPAAMIGGAMVGALEIGAVVIGIIIGRDGAARQDRGQEQCAGQC